MESLTLPLKPATPEPIQPPVLEVQTPPTAQSPAEYLKQCKEVARAIKVFVKASPSMRVRLDGKRYAYAPVWQFCAACFGVTPMVTKTEELLNDNREEMGYLSIAHAIDRTGRVISGAEATCMCTETDWANKPSFQLRSMAETRSCIKVLSNLYRYVMVMAGFCPTPAEEMTPGPRRASEKNFKTQCVVSSCPNMISEKRRLKTTAEHGKALCVPCEKKHIAKLAEDKTMGVINDPGQVAEFIDRAKERKANGGAQPVVALLDSAEDIA